MAAAITAAEIQRWRWWGRIVCGLLMIAWLLAVLAMTAGCSVFPARVKAARVGALIHKGSPELKQSGDVAAPASAAVETSVTSLPLPAGSVVSVTPRSTVTPAQSQKNVTDQANDSGAASRITVTLSQPSELRTETRREAVEGAKSFTPPAPPSAAEVAKAKGVLWFYIAGGICGLLAVAAFVMSFPRAGVALALGAVGMPIVGAFLGSAWALPILGAAAAGAFAYWHGWHVQKTPGSISKAAPAATNITAENLPAAV